MSLAEAEPAVHDVLNVFMCTGFTRDTGQYFMKARPFAPVTILSFLPRLICWEISARAPAVIARQSTHRIRHRAILYWSRPLPRPKAHLRVGAVPRATGMTVRTGVRLVRVQLEGKAA